MINIKSAKLYCNGDITQIENYDKAINDDTQTWECHHRRETDEGLPREQLIELSLYLNRPTNELIFLTKSEHSRLHQSGKPKSEEHKRNISKSLKGKEGGMKGKHHTEESKRKDSESMKGKNKGKIPKNKGGHRVYHEDGTYHYEK